VADDDDDSKYEIILEVIQRLEFIQTWSSEKEEFSV
jgi:hypothetical protein